MKITKSQLKQIIKEEIKKVFEDMDPYDVPTPRMPRSRRQFKELEKLDQQRIAKYKKQVDLGMGLKSKEELIQLIHAQQKPGTALRNLETRMEQYDCDRGDIGLEYELAHTFLYIAYDNGLMEDEYQLGGMPTRKVEELYSNYGSGVFLFAEMHEDDPQPWVFDAAKKYLQQVLCKGLN